VTRPAGLAIAAAALLAASPGDAIRAADVKVTQGPPQNLKALVSPMLLEMPLEVAAGKGPGGWINVDDFDAWSCDFVHIRRIATRVAWRQDRVDLDIKVFTYTEPSRDKAVRMEFRLLKDEDLIGETVLPHLEAEERKRGYGTATMTIAKDRWPAAGPLVMKIAVQVKND
jgi:hypothetical protein